MAFDDYQIQYRVLTSDEVFAAMLEYHRQTSVELAQERRRPLTRDSELGEWEMDCDCVDFAFARRNINCILGTNFDRDEWKKIAGRNGCRTLGEFCDRVAPRTWMPRIETVTVLGIESRAAGAFLLVRRLLTDAGVSPHEITPATELGDYLQRRGVDSTLWKLCCAAPGCIPQAARVPTSAGGVAGCCTLLMIVSAIAGVLLRSHRLQLAAVAYLMLAAFSACVFGVEHKPGKLQLGWLKTFRDLSRAMAGEVWGAWRGFPMEIAAKEIKVSP